MLKSSGTRKLPRAGAWRSDYPALDGAIRLANQGLDAIRAEDIEGTFNVLERAQRVVLELSNGLRREVNPEPVDQLSSLYHFIYRRVVDANMHHDVQAVEEAVKMLRHQRETWVLLIGKLSEASSAPPGAQRQQPAAANGDDESALSVEG